MWIIVASCTVLGVTWQLWWRGDGVTGQRVQCMGVHRVVHECAFLSGVADDRL
jgi:hypothetical protein